MSSHRLTVYASLCRLIAITAYRFPPYILFPIYILCNNKRHGSLRRPCLYFLTDWICRLSASLPAEHKNRQYDNRKRADTYYPVSVICPVHLLFVFHTLQTLFQLVIELTYTYPLYSRILAGLSRTAVFRPHFPPNTKIANMIIASEPIHIIQFLLYVRFIFFSCSMRSRRFFSL